MKPFLASYILDAIYGKTALKLLVKLTTVGGQRRTNGRGGKRGQYSVRRLMLSAT
jgi:hypothetical protein